MLKDCGDNLVVESGVYFDNPSNISLGSNVWIDRNCILIAGISLNENIRKIKPTFNEGEMHIGNNAHLGIRTVIQAHGGVKIGDFFTSGTDSKLYTMSNDVKLSKNGTHYPDKKSLFYDLHPIKIENNVWVGMQAIILGGTIGSDVFISNNSVCLGDYQSNSILEGSPAIKIKDRFI